MLGTKVYKRETPVSSPTAKSLACRVGTNLLRLFIDEGFGSQEDSGRSRSVEAINRIRDDFDMIMVITHIAKLRASFPVQ